MKKVCVLSMGKETSSSVASQLRRLIGDSIQVESYCLKDDLSKPFKDSLVVITSLLVKNLAIPRLHPSTEYIVSRRAINYQHLKALISLKDQSEVLLVNDSKDSCMLTIAQLQKHGINHIKYSPYYPEIKNYKKLPIAITPGEPHLIPTCVKKVIDIGTRQIDITTLVEILKRFGLMEQKGDMISSQFVRDIVNVLKDLKHIAERSKDLKNMFETIVNHSREGIIYIDLKGNVWMVNETFASTIDLLKEKIMGKNITKILPQLEQWKVEEDTEGIIQIENQEMILTNHPIKKQQTIIGYMITIEKTTKIQDMEYEIRRKKRKSEHRAVYSFEDIISNSKEMKKKIRLAKKLACSDSTVLIQGESGTGKELFAHAIHESSKRRNGPFVPVNFAALSVNLLESELFGYEEGAFTGARRGGKQGLFEQAHGGTLFLDEIGDAPLSFQARLLRVLQEKQIRRVGGGKIIPIDVRVIAATNKNLIDEVQKGYFRQDLFYRINVLPLVIPSLNQRKEDIPYLLEFYLKKFTKGNFKTLESFMTCNVIEYLLTYHWPGNIRELVNVIEYLSNIKEDHRLIRQRDLPTYIGKNEKQIDASEDGLDENMLWVLQKTYEKEGIGRRMIAEEAKKQGKKMGEGKIRGILKKLEEKKLIKIHKGLKGNCITSKGIHTIHEIHKK